MSKIITTDLLCWLNGQASVGYQPLVDTEIGTVSPAMSRLTPVNGTGNQGGRSPTYGNVVLNQQVYRISIKCKYYCSETPSSNRAICLWNLNGMIGVVPFLLCVM